MLATIITLISFILVFLSSKFVEYCKAKRLFENVKWCVSYNPSSPYDTKPEIKMRDTILYLQRKAAVEEKYLIADTEFDTVCEILRSFQQDVVLKYFNSILPNYKFDSKECFIFYLDDFLCKNQCKDTFNGNEMYEIKNKKYHGTWGATFSATYVLTDYAVTYHKLYYIVQLAIVEINTRLNKEVTGVHRAEETKKALDTREIAVSNY